MKKKSAGCQESCQGKGFGFYLIQKKERLSCRPPQRFDDSKDNLILQP
jgi:hypothetical protein